VTDFVIVSNPRAGSFSEEVENKLLQDLREISPRAIRTDFPGHATKIARELPDDAWILVLGGDGTINEVVNGIVGTRKVLVPYAGGTGSDLVRTTGHLDSGTIISGFKSGKQAEIDCGKITFKTGERYFVNSLEIGFGANVMRRVNAKHKRGKRAFTSSVLREVPSLKAYDLAISSEEFSNKVSAIEVIVANGRFFGGGMLASPGSKLDDGKLDVHLIHKIGRGRLILNFKKVVNGSYVNMEFVSNFSTSKVAIEGDVASVEADGESLGETPISVEVVPGSVRVLKGTVS
jgi:YegS/Rv2252/BmrU family lipid kinase